MDPKFLDMKWDLRRPAHPFPDFSVFADERVQSIVIRTFGLGVLSLFFFAGAIALWTKQPYSAVATTLGVIGGVFGIWAAIYFFPGVDRFYRQRDEPPSWQTAAFQEQVRQLMLAAKACQDRYTHVTPEEDGLKNPLRYLKRSDAIRVTYHDERNPLGTPDNIVELASFVVDHMRGKVWFPPVRDAELHQEIQRLLMFYWEAEFRALNKADAADIAVNAESAELEQAAREMHTLDEARKKAVAIEQQLLAEGLSAEEAARKKRWFENRVRELLER